MPTKSEQSIQYHEFIEDNHLGPDNDGLSISDECPANSYEIGWQKQLQIKRAIQHLRTNQITPVELHLLRDHGVIAIPNPHTKQVMEKTLKGELYPVEIIQR